MPDAWILAAGRGTRNKYKLLTPFDGKTLPEWACLFAEQNGYTPHVITSQEQPGTAGALAGRTGLVLFGDNFYYGKIPIYTKAMFTFSWRDSDGLAVVAGDKIIEKPHNFFGIHKCFTGFCYVDRWVDIDMSARGEYEITDLLNAIDAESYPLGVKWEHYSVPGDYERVLAYVLRRQREEGCGCSRLVSDMRCSDTESGIGGEPA